MELPLRLRDHDVIGNCLADRTVQILIGHRGKQMQWARLGNASFKVAVRFPAAPPRVHIGALHATGSDTRRACVGSPRHQRAAHLRLRLVLPRVGSCRQGPSGKVAQWYSSTRTTGS